MKIWIVQDSSQENYCWGSSKGALKWKACFSLGEFRLGIIVPQCPFLSVFSLFEVALLWDWSHDSCLHAISPYIPIFWSRGPPWCLCVADTQAKQEETGDSHWGLRVQTSINAPSRWGSGLSDCHKYYCRPNSCEWLHRPGQCGWHSYLPLWCGVCPQCIRIMCVFESAVWQPMFTSTKLDNPGGGQTLQCPCRAAQTEK